MSLNSETENGKLVHQSNELLNDALDLDAAAFRGGAPKDQRVLVKYTGDVVDDRSRDEIGQISFKQSEDEHDVVDGRRGGEFYLGLKTPGSGSTDQAQVKIFNAVPPDPQRGFAGGIFCDVPVFAPNLGSGGGSGGFDIVRMWAPDGLHFTQQQSDGNFVTYRTRVPYSIAPQDVTAVWSAWTGRIG
jgi:hypothetical protein